MATKENTNVPTIGSPLFVLTEGALLVITVLIGFGLRSHWLPEWALLPLIPLVPIHLVAVPICFLYLIGKPVVSSNSPLLPSPESRAYEKELRERAVLSDDEFHARYYNGSNVSKEVTARTRRALHSVDKRFERAIPSDHLYLLYDDEVDFADVVRPVAREFGWRFAKTDYERMDGTLDNLICLVQQRLESRSS